MYYKNNFPSVVKTLFIWPGYNCKVDLDPIQAIPQMGRKGYFWNRLQVRYRTTEQRIFLMVLLSRWKEGAFRAERCLKQTFHFTSVCPLFSVTSAAALQPRSYLTWMHLARVWASVWNGRALLCKQPSASTSSMLLELTLKSIENFFHSILSFIRSGIHALFLIMPKTGL